MADLLLFTPLSVPQCYHLNEFNCLMPPSLLVPDAFCIRVCPSLSECVSLCIPKTLWIPYLKNQWKELRPILVTDVFGFTDVLISFCSQKVKGHDHSRQWSAKPGEYNIQLFCNYLCSAEIVCSQ